MTSVDDVKGRWRLLAESTPCPTCLPVHVPTGDCKDCRGTGLQDCWLLVLGCKDHGVVYSRVSNPVCGICGISAKWMQAKDLGRTIDREMFASVADRRMNFRRGINSAGEHGKLRLSPCL